MNKTVIFELLSMIPWILYFIECVYYKIAVCENCKMNKNEYLNYIDHNLFRMFNIKEIILFIVFVVVLIYTDEYIIKSYFALTYLYLLADFFKYWAKYCKKIKHISIMIINIILIAIIFTLYFLKVDLRLIYIMMFSVSILSSFHMYIYLKTN